MFSLLVYCIYLAIKRHRQSKLAKAEENSRVMRFLWSSNGVLFLNLIVGGEGHRRETLAVQEELISLGCRSVALPRVSDHI